MTATLKPPPSEASHGSSTGYVVEEPKDLIRDYCLVGQATELAIQRGLAKADWYQCPVPPDVMRSLLQRSDGPAIRDTILWFALLAVSGYLGFALWGSWWAILPFAVYGVIYGSTSDSRWHESSHGTAFKTDWMNNALYEIASFMVMRESTLWRWSHTRHHSDTIIVGRDPEIAVPRPPNVRAMLLTFVGLPPAIGYFRKIIRHSLGSLDAEEQTYVPRDQWGRIVLVARVHLLVYLAVVAAAIYSRSILPLMYIGLPNLYGGWLMPIYGWTQHAGLAENVLDHRLNCRTVYMNALHRFLYWNMNYHVEHHMFPLVPYHQLPKLHAAVKHDMPTPYPSILSAWREIVPAVLRQRKDPGFYIRRRLPLPKPMDEAQQLQARRFNSAGQDELDGWIEACPASALKLEDVVRFDHGSQTFAIYRTADGKFHATDGMCTHGRVHLAEGFVKGNLVECAKHNGRFDIRDGSAKRPPVCVGLRTYPVKQQAGMLWLDLDQPGGAGALVEEQVHTFRVVRNGNVATYIRELVLAPGGNNRFLYNPGDYLQLMIPAYRNIRFADLQVPEPYHSVWKANHVFDYESSNRAATWRNYSLASNAKFDDELLFNVRIAAPPRGQDCPAGIGSTYLWSLKPGDTVQARGPFGEFHIRDTFKEMVYIGGGAGMAPLRAHISHLLENLSTSRRISYWYGARSLQELFYVDYFEKLAQRHSQFKFHVALSEPLPEDNWCGPTGFIHQVVYERYLQTLPKPQDLEYYLCGPPAMIAATRQMLEKLGVPKEAVLFDEF